MKTKLEEKMKRIYYIFIVCIMSAFMLSCGKKQDVNIPDKQEEKVQQEEKKEKEIPWFLAFCKAADSSDTSGNRRAGVLLFWRVCQSGQCHT